MTQANILLFIFVIFLLLCIASIIFMFISIGKQGDELRKMIIQKTSANTFYIAIGLLLFDVIERVSTAFVNFTPHPANSFIRLAMLSFTYVILLAYYKHKFGLTHHEKYNS